MRLRVWYINLALLALIVFVSTPAWTADPEKGAGTSTSPAGTSTSPAGTSESPAGMTSESPGGTSKEAASTSKSAAGKSHKGKVVEAGGGKLKMTDMEGKNEHSHDVAADAKIKCAGKPCSLEDLKPGTRVSVTTAEKDGQPVVTKISTRKKAAQAAEKTNTETGTEKGAETGAGKTGM